MIGEERRWTSRAGQVARIAGAGAVAAIGTAALARWRAMQATRGLTSQPNPADSFDDAVARFRGLVDAEGAEIDPVCHSVLLDHGKATERAVVLMHGITNCPAQFAQLAPLLFDRGYNVLVPRLPRHGLLDKMTDDLKNLTAEELRDFSDNITDIAVGLAKRVTVVGLSAGGVMAAWIAQHRSDVERAVLIAPSIGVGQFGRGVEFTIAAIALAIPDIATQRFFPNPKDITSHGYVGFSTRSLGHVLRLAGATARSAAKSPPGVQHVVVISNSNDTAVSNGLTRQLISLWQAKGLRWVEEFDFPKDAALLHDLVDPAQKRQKVDLVYPILVELLSRGAPSLPTPASEATAGAF